MKRALQAWLDTAARSGNRIAACTAAAESVAQHPWEVVRQAGTLARAGMAPAPRDLGIGPGLQILGPNAQGLLARVAEGAPYPALDRSGRRKRGAFDTPSDMAHQTVRLALSAAHRPIEKGLDPACGTGAFLVAMADAGISRVHGVELDPAAAAVARIAAPSAHVQVGNGFIDGGNADLVVGNPPFVPPERQDKALRARLRSAYPWLKGRFDLAVPFAAAAVERVRPGGGVGLVLPAPMMSQPYATPLRRRWLEQHRIQHLSPPTPFPGATVQVVLLSLTTQAGPAPLPKHDLASEALLGLETAPFDHRLQAQDLKWVEQIRAVSIDLGTLCTIDTGVVSHGPKGGKARLLSDTHQSGWVPYVDAKDLAVGRTRWLNYRPDEMHRAKHPSLFESPKVIVQRLRGRGPVRAWVDEDGLFAGHTLTVIRPDDSRLSVKRIHELVSSPLVDGLLRIERGERLDLYPRDVRSIPVPMTWMEDHRVSLEAAWDLPQAALQRLKYWAG